MPTNAQLLAVFEGLYTIDGSVQNNADALADAFAALGVYLGKVVLSAEDFYEAWITPIVFATPPAGKALVNPVFNGVMKLNGAVAPPQDGYNLQFFYTDQNGFPWGNWPAIALAHVDQIFQPETSPTPPTPATSYAKLAGQPLVGFIGEGDPGVPGVIVTTAINTAGTGFAHANTFDLDSGGLGPNATGVVDTVGGGGEILTYHLLTFGTGYTLYQFDVIATSGVGVGAILDVTEVDVSGNPMTITVYVRADLVDV